MNQKTYRIRRLTAAFLDWLFCGLPVVVIGMLLMPLVEKGLPPFLMLLLILSFPVGFLCRDRIFKGRSLGKRVLGLTVLDRRTLQPLGKKQLVTRNLFYCLGGLEPFVLMFTGTTLGDRAVAALVVPMDQIPEEPLPTGGYQTGKKGVAKVLLMVALFFLLVFCIAFLGLESVKDEPHYALAHSYLTNSDTFAQLGAESEDVRFTGYHYSSTTRNGVTETEASFTFQVKGRSLIVICHPQGEDWYVCPDCTTFR